MADEKVFVFYSDALKYKAVETENNGREYYVEGFVSTGDLDLVNDIVTPDGIKDMARQLKERNVKIDFEHESFKGEDPVEAQINKTILPLGRVVDSKSDDKKIWVNVKLNPSWKKLDKDGNVTRVFSDVWSSIKGKFLDAFSIAYVPTKTASKRVGDTKARLLDGVNLLNVALTGNPVNPYSTMTAVMAKSLEYLNHGEKADVKDHSAKWHRCVDDVRKQGGVSSPEAVCTAALGNESFKSSEGGIMSEEDKKHEKKDEEVKPEGKVEKPEAKAEAKPEEKPAEDESAEPEGEAEEDEPEQKGEDQTVEVKKRLDALEKENKELKSIVENAQRKSKGAESKDKAEPAQVKSKGPLDYL